MSSVQCQCAVLLEWNGRPLVVGSTSTVRERVRHPAGWLAGRLAGWLVGLGNQCRSRGLGSSCLVRVLAVLGNQSVSLAPH